jgi:glucosamine--fructose-6-phosphate aminotransferase (isomerizing)
MCGIVTAIATQNVVPVLLEGLRKLEYRGYDSAGLAVLAGELTRLRSCGRVAELASLADARQLSAHIGIAHTRWATHGVPSERNAHPHISGGLAVVHNGIIENFEAIKNDLQGRGYVFESETDTEAIAHLVHFKLQATPDLFEAVRQATNELVGAYAIGVVAEADPFRIIVARRGSPLLLGIGEDGMYAASDTAALLQVTRKIVYLEDGDLAELRRESYIVIRPDGSPVEREVHISSLSADAVELGKYRHYMQKEIFEQPQALAQTLELIAGGAGITPQHFGARAAEVFDGVRRVLILACGTSYHAGLVARYWIEAIAKIPVTVEIASEYRYRESVPDPDTLVVVISQSGETADTLAALKHAKALGMERTLAICNVPESAIVRETALRFITRAGPEIGVASTKAFTTQLAAFALLTLALAKINGRLTAADEERHLTALRHLPVAVQKVLELEPEIEQWAQRFAGKEHALFLGRGSHWPIAMEGALKLKEISYIHAEAYAAG